MECDKKLYKTYHRGYGTVEELYDDLCDIGVNIELDHNRIIIRFSSDTLEIELSKRGGYYVYLNGQQENSIWDDQDLYPYVLNFYTREERLTR